MLGEELKRARKAAGLTQEQLASAADLHSTYVSMLECDKKSPTLDVLFRICDAVEIRPHRLILRLERSLAKTGRTYPKRRR